MKDLSPRWAAATLLTPVILILSLILLANLNHARAAKVAASRGTVVIGFTGSVVQVDANDDPIPNPPPLPFQHVYLNVISVRLNPSTSGIVSDSEGGWATIPVPAGFGNSTTTGLVETGLNFGGELGYTANVVSLAEGRSEIQIDAAQLPQTPILFNAWPIFSNNYNQVELVLDSSTFKVSGSNPTTGGPTQISSNAGNVVPLCGAAGTLPSGEGCIVYPVTIYNPSETIGVANAPVEVGRQGLVPVMINIQVDVESPSLANGGPIIIQPHISLVQNSGVSQSGQPLNQDLGLITGTVSNYAAGNKTVVTAEQAGTNNVVEQYNVQSTGPTAGNYTLYLPAPAGGASYDLYVSGPGRQYAVKSGVTVTPGSQIIGSPTNGFDFTTPTVNSTTLGGTIKDECATSVPVEAATLQLLVPDPSISPAPDCTASPPTGCVVVATSATDEGGTYPLPGSGNVPAPFQNVPTDQNYTMLINAAGFDPVVAAVQPSGNNKFTCTSPDSEGSSCNFQLSHGYLGGTVTLASAATSPMSAMVMAEDTGTNNIQNFAQVVIPTGQSSGNFSMPVPDGVGNFDLFAQVQDDFEGQPQLQSMHTPQQNTGHSIAVEAAVGAPAACATVTADPLGPVECLGHGSLEGGLANVTNQTSVVLEQPDPNNNNDLVQTLSAVVGPFGSDSAGGYAICAPPEADYSLQRFDNGVAGEATAVGPMSGPVIVPTGAPSASFTPTPCPGICDDGQGTSCLYCTETSGPSL
ncbi:MAG TPA: hypothetical protein VMF50_18835 [Candidatus Binataceae bacterium]|nr:hypothetical protein [Candidatus Binataceae bacterium]